MKQKMMRQQWHQLDHVRIIYTSLQTDNHGSTHTHTQSFYGSMDFVRDNPGEPVPEETFTHSHLLWSSIVPYLLNSSTTIHDILPVQSTHLTVPYQLVFPGRMPFLPPNQQHQSTEGNCALLEHVLNLNEN